MDVIRIKKKLFITFLIVIFFIIGVLLVTNKQENVNDIINRSINESQETSNRDEESNKVEDKDDGDDEESDVRPVSEFKELITETVYRAQDFFSIKNHHITALGDSLTQGSGDETNNGGYIGILDDTINHDKDVVQIENFAIHGHRTDQLLARLDDGEVIDSIQDTDIVLITIGANDIMQVAKENFTNLTFEMFDEERDQFEVRLNEILSGIKDLNPDTHIYLIGLYNPFEQYFQDIEELDDIVDDWNETSEMIVKNYEKTTFIPIKDLFEDAEGSLFSDDKFHPNTTGYQLMANRVLDYIIEVDR
ncbi:MAG TPA: SGNH/GDSL hydrolase family protein [Virgibacillus sp.]|nr:SGNH/GDSL hydrolase family protein [Virgibacillus sp.]